MRYSRVRLRSCVSVSVVAVSKILASIAARSASHLSQNRAKAGPFAMLSRKRWRSLAGMSWMDSGIDDLRRLRGYGTGRGRRGKGHGARRIYPGGARLDSGLRRCATQGLRRHHRRERQHRVDVIMAEQVKTALHQRPDHRDNPRRGYQEVRILLHDFEGEAVHLDRLAGLVDVEDEFGVDQDVTHPRGFEHAHLAHIALEEDKRLVIIQNAAGK